MIQSSLSGTVLSALCSAQTSASRWGEAARRSGSRAVVEGQQDFFPSLDTCFYGAEKGRFHSPGFGNGEEETSVEVIKFAPFFVSSQLRCYLCPARSALLWELVRWLSLQSTGEKCSTFNVVWLQQQLCSAHKYLNYHPFFCHFNFSWRDNKWLQSICFWEKRMDLLWESIKERMMAK